MAHDADPNKKKSSSQTAAEMGQSANPYEELTAGMAEPAAQFGGELPGASGPTATGHINFDSIYNANEGVASREAGNRANAAEAKAKGAQGELTGARNQFQEGVNAGYIGGPTQQQRGWASQGPTGVQHGKQVQAAGVGNASTGDQGYISEQQEVFEQPHPSGGTTHGASETEATSGTGGVTPQNVGKELPAVAPPYIYDPATSAADEAAVRAGAGGKYTGPASLSADSDAYAKLLQDSIAAEQGVDALGSNTGLQATGLSKLDAALIGASGRPRFAQLGQQYGAGKLTKGVTDANASTVDQANSARTQSEKDAAAYQALLDQYTGRQSAEQGEEDQRTARSDAVLAKAATDADAKKRFNDYLHGGDAGDQTRNVLHTIGKAISPSEAVTGDAGLVNMGTNAISPQSADNKGNVWGGWSDDDYDVWSSMTDSDWAEFAGLSDAAKHEWINARKKKLRGGGK